LVNLVDELVMHGVLADGEGGWMVRGDIDTLVQQVPESSRQLITVQMSRMSPATQQTLAAASVAGTIFSAAAVAAALDTLITEVETRCEEVTRQQLFVQRAGMEAWPDGTVAARYGFRHALYQELWHEQGTVNQRQEWHQRIGLRKELAYNGRASEIAAELAVHFEQGHDTRRAILYLEQAAQNASARSANREAIQHLTKGLELLKTLPDTPERIRQELDLQTALGTAFMAIKGYSAPEVENAYARARELSRQVEEAPRLSSLLYGLWVFHLVRGELQTALEVAQQFMRLAQNVNDPSLLMEAHHALGQILYFLGDFPSSIAHLEQNLALYDPQQHSPAVRRNVQDLGVMGLCYAALSLWNLGYPDQALQRVSAAHTLAQKLGHPFSLVFALQTAAHIHFKRREWPAAQEQAERQIACATEQGFLLFVGMGAIYRGWALAQQGKENKEEMIAQLRQYLTSYRAAGAELGRPFYLFWQADAYGERGYPEVGLSLLTEALAFVDKAGERVWEAEAYRLKGELILQSQASLGQAPGKSRTSRKRVQNKFKTSQNKASADPGSLTPDPQGEACFLKAIEVARRQQAKSLELRAVTSLARLWQGQGKPREAHQMLAEIYGWFTEGFDTKDLQEAKALLEALARDE
jgi:tetratricopeptide (TPR) repeat protein